MNPGDIFGSFGAQALAVLPWVAAAVGAAVGLALVLLGVAKGLAFFMRIVEGEDGPRRSLFGGGAERVQWADWHDEAYDLGLSFGLTDDNASDFATDWADGRADGMNGAEAAKYAEKEFNQREHFKTL